MIHKCIKFYYETIHFADDTRENKGNLSADDPLFPMFRRVGYFFDTLNKKIPDDFTA
jgi:hypothetical protein